MATSGFPQVILSFYYIHISKVTAKIGYGHLCVRGDNLSFNSFDFDFSWVL